MSTEYMSEMLGGNEIATGKVVVEEKFKELGDLLGKMVGVARDTHVIYPDASRWWCLEVVFALVFYCKMQSLGVSSTMVLIFPRTEYLTEGWMS